MFAGCTISVILFLAPFNVIFEYVSQTGLPWYSLSTRKLMPVLRAFMDDVILMTTSTPASKIDLQITAVALKWARMKLKPKKSRSLLIKGGKCIDEKPFQVAEEIIPSIQKKPSKTLGRVYNISVTDRQAQDDLKKIKQLLQKTDRLLLTDIMKEWVYHNLLLAKIGRPLIIYENLYLGWNK